MFLGKEDRDESSWCINWYLVRVKDTRLGGRDTWDFSHVAAARTSSMAPGQSKPDMRWFASAACRTKRERYH